MASELEVTKLEVKAVISLYPEKLKPLPVFDSATQYGSEMKLIEKSISSIKSTMGDFQNR